MKPLFLAAAVAAFFVTGCVKTREVCRTYGNETICRTEREPSAAESKRRADRAAAQLDIYNCIERGEGDRGYCRHVYKGY